MGVSAQNQQMDSTTPIAFFLPLCFSPLRTTPMFYNKITLQILGVLAQMLKPHCRLCLYQNGKHKLKDQRDEDNSTCTGIQVRKVLLICSLKDIQSSSCHQIYSTSKDLILEAEKLLQKEFSSQKTPTHLD